MQSFQPRPITEETRATVSTREAAFHLSRQFQTLHTWAAYGKGPIQPIRVNGRLAWPVAAIKRVLGVQ